MSQNANRNRMKTTRTKTSAMKPSPISSTESINSLPTMNSSELKFQSFENSFQSTIPNTSIPDELKSGQPMDLNQLLKNAISTSDESESTEKPAKRPDRFAKLEDGFTDQFTSLGVLVMAFHQEDGAVIVSRANPLASKLTDVARQNPAVYKALKRYLEGSAYINLVGEVATIGLAIMANHGINPVGWILDKAKGKHADGDSELSAVA